MLGYFKNILINNKNENVHNYFKANKNIQESLKLYNNSQLLYNQIQEKTF